MDKEQQFLDTVLQKIERKIAQINEQLEAGARDVEAMHEYYWENYTEMDEYGYENFDNQQALLTAVNANNDQLQMKFRCQKMLSSPYFGRVDFCYEGEDAPESFYIGIGNFAEQKGRMPLIYDWRAPVSSLFYDYDSGPAKYEAPAGELTGEITSKWQYKIRHGRMIYACESDMKIDDDILRQELGTPGDVKLKNIIRTIQKEQNAIIRNTKDRILVIQGVAGSGKTSVALHRIAYLLYHDRARLNSSNVLILSPNSVFSDYISHILPELGEEHIREMSFDTFAYHELKPWISDCQNRCDYVEELLAGQELPYYKEKQSEHYLKELYGFALSLEYELIDFQDLHIRRWTKPAREIQDLFYGSFTDYPLLSRMDVVMEYCIDEYETLADTSIDEEQLEKVEEQCRKMFLTTDLYEIYQMFLEEQGYPLLPEGEGAVRFLPYEDVYPMLYLKYLLYSRTAHKKIKHLIIDEMQDYSYLQYRILEMLFSCKMTILGDKAQTMDEEVQDVTRFLPSIFGRDIRVIEMNKSYRNTMEIAAYAGSISKYQNIDLFERHGDSVSEQQCSDWQTALDRVADAILAQNELTETSAVLTFSAREALDAFLNLRERLKTAGYDTENKLHLIDQDSEHFKAGVTVTTFYLAKGLEFEQVYLLDDVRRHGTLYTQARYICATRALHGLHVYHFSAEAEEHAQPETEKNQK